MVQSVALNRMVRMPQAIEIYRGSLRSLGFLVSVASEGPSSSASRFLRASEAAGSISRHSTPLQFSGGTPLLSGTATDTAAFCAS